MTLVESLAALAILSVAILGIAFTATVGHQHSHHGDAMLRAVRLAEHLMEEVISRPYSGSGADRLTFHMDDYDAFEEALGTIRDFNGTLYGPDDQRFTRSASVNGASHAVPDLGGTTFVGKTIVVTVRDQEGAAWEITRFVPEPASP